MLYEVMHTVVPPLAKVVWRPTVEGLENLPTTGPVIVASNHRSFADSMPNATLRPIPSLWGHMGERRRRPRVPSW